MMKTMTNMTKIRSTSFSPTKKTSLRTMNEKRLAKSRETGTWWLK